ncbi:hypothetical protein PtA15_6A854 [Puccinia triticina]|uniref:Uncharacterized protein n=1 Tax=Puccinia triticina TaxID=208348 RepID=A0ABY7CQF8_9BASI|nr:uncharacterized protein PtA15_6A854 [Puccinia triticina]WAQ86222.1 hypothetical protein PtA15_6A854 [Puccinia triticina]
MHLALELDCSFLDLSGDDPAYDSPTSSQEDEPVDGKVLPLPPRGTLRRNRPSRRNVYHNQPSSGGTSPAERRPRQRSGNPDDISLLSLSDIRLPLASSPEHPPGQTPPIAAPTALASSTTSSSYSSLLDNITHHCARYLESHPLPQPPPSELASPFHTRKPLINTPPLSGKASKPPRPQSPTHQRNGFIPQSAGHPTPEAGRKPQTTTATKRLDAGLSRSCSIKLLSFQPDLTPLHLASQLIHDSSSSSTTTTTSSSSSSSSSSTTSSSPDTITTSSPATNFEILIAASSSGPLSTIHPNQPSHPILKSKQIAIKDQPPSTKNNFELFNQTNIASALYLSHTIHQGKENMLDHPLHLTEDDPLEY